MKAFPLHLLATATLGLSLASCDNSTSPKEAPKTTETTTPAEAGAPPAASANNARIAGGATDTEPSTAAKARTVALPAGLKVGRWQGFLTTQKRAVHFVFEVNVEDNKAIGYLVNEGPGGQERLRCASVRAVGDSAIISLPGAEGTLVVRANGLDHLAGAWVRPVGKTPSRMAFSAVYGERSPLRSDMAPASFAGSWRATFKDRNGKNHPATLVFEQQGAKLLGALTSAGGSYRYLSGAALPEGMGISSFDGRHGVLLQGKKQPDGTLKGDFYDGQSTHETWTAVPAGTTTTPPKPAGR